MHRSIFLLLLALGGCSPASSAERLGWQEDFDALADHMAVVYANLEWAVQERGINTAQLYQDTRAALGNASSRRSARKLVRRFVASFDDPHMRVSNGDSRAPGQGGVPDPGVAPDIGADDALETIGFRGRDLDFKIDFERLPGFTHLEPSATNPFAWGIFTVGEKTVGVLRIAHFGDDGYPQVARPLWDDFASELAGPCDNGCQWQFRTMVMDRLLAYLAEGARALADAGVDAVLIDITGNGGGTDWAAVAPRIFTPPLLHCPPIGVVRHPHHGGRLAHRADYFQLLLDERPLSGSSRMIVTSAQTATMQRAMEASKPCDRRSAFHAAGALPDCTQLTFGPACGALEYLAPGSLSDLEERAVIFEPLNATFEEGTWAGPLFVLTDGGTASASEQFVSLLEANGAAVLMGEKTYGAGCGFIAGGIPIYLPHIDVTVRMPDCARYRANGRNELEGIEPQVQIDMDGNNREKARRVHDALAGLL